MNPMRQGLILSLRLYRAVVSPVLTALLGPLGMGCRYTPTCSQYSLEAIQTHGAVKGTWLTLRRLCRCHPWGAFGLDPVPPKSHRYAVTQASSLQVMTLPASCEAGGLATCTQDACATPIPITSIHSEPNLHPSQHGS